MEAPHAYAPRIYFVHSLLVGPLDAWSVQFEHAASLGFDHVLIGALFRPGAAGHTQIVSDHAQLHPVFATDQSTADALHGLTESASQYGLTLLADLVIDRVAADGALFEMHRDWFHPFEPDEARLDPRHARHEDNVAYANYSGDTATQLTDWWAQALHMLAEAGLGGFRFDSPHRVPNAVWRRLRDAMHEQHPSVRFLAATPGLTLADVASLEGAGFDSVFSSSRWWDFRAPWMLDEHAALLRAGAPIAFPEAPYGTRLVHDVADTHDATIVERTYRRGLAAATAIGTGWLMPMGFEYGVAEPMSYLHGDPQAFAGQCRAGRFDLSERVKHANALQRDTWTLQTAGELRVLSAPNAPLAVLLRGDQSDLRDSNEAVLAAFNPELSVPVHAEPARFLDGVPGSFTRFVPLVATGGAARGAPAPLRPFALAPAGFRLLGALPDKPVQLAPPIDKRTSKTSARKTVLDAIAAPRVAIESVSPSVDGGRFPAKRVVGERVAVTAAIFAEGHDKIAAAVIWRAADETAWHEVPMTPVQPAGNDLWETRVPLERVGRHEFTVIAWRDDFASLVDHMQKKLNADQPVDLELEEAKHLFALALAEAETAGEAEGNKSGDKSNGKAEEKAAQASANANPDPNANVSHADPKPLEHVVNAFTKADKSERLRIVLAPQTAQAVAATRHRPSLSRDGSVYRIDAERTAARFASWYEIFPRSMSDDEHRHGTFDDVIGKLPRIRDMGFDVLYFPPIHPIGMANRKGRNNTLTPGPDDVGSPYAIGGEAGGHTAVHPQLGTLDEFRRMLAAAHEHGLEIALDFAIQCSPDHPWLKDHPTWFAWRPDGTLRYAENPPKKYQDIVNPDFYARDAKPDLWIALRDVILFWIDAGVRVFRVDNPHTKPLPFWEWMIADVRARHPDVIFLSEAFTRPRVMARLAKVGFSQSYTYFTWRESKRDFTEYLTELTQTNLRDYFRPNFFVNTPDINPRHLQWSGRAGFVIRAALAATLSGLWGVYSGFELCEAAALPNSEEYLDSEKYQLRAWDWNRPGNIVGEITALNRIRRANPALHTHLGLTFLPAHNDHILFFEKATDARDNVIVVAINLDPFNEQGADIELSWTTFNRWQIHDQAHNHAAVDVVDQMNGERFQWQGRWQHVRLDPNTRPFAIWRIEPAGGLPREAIPETEQAAAAAADGFAGSLSE